MLIFHVVVKLTISKLDLNSSSLNLKALITLMCTSINTYVILATCDPNIIKSLVKKLYLYRIPLLAIYTCADWLVHSIPFKAINAV